MGHRLTLILLILAFVLSFALNNQTSVFYFPVEKNPHVLRLMLIVTTIGLFIFFLSLSARLFYGKKITELTLLFLSVSLSFIFGITLKNFFQIPRVEVYSLYLPLSLASGYSFPSLHTAVIFSALPTIEKLLSRKYVALSYFFALLIAFSRLYLGVHTIIDVTFGMFLGYLLGLTVLNIEKRFKIIEIFFHHIKNKFELRRQIVHMLSALSIVMLYKIRFINQISLFVILAFGGILSFLSRKKPIPLIKTLLVYFERDYPRSRFPGQGSFFLVLGSFLSLSIFEENIALAAITIMAIGDAASNIIGLYFGKIKNPFNRVKHLEGTFCAIIFSFFGAWYFVPFNQALSASTLAMFIESIDLKIGPWKIDDNLIIPLIAGATMSLF